MLSGFLPKKTRTMNGTKLMHQFRAFSDEDLVAFKKYLAVNGPQQLQSLFNYMLKHRHGQDSRFEKKQVYDKLFTQEKSTYNDDRLRNIMARLGQQMEAFLIETELAKDAELNRQLLIRAYKKRDAYFLFYTEISTRLRKLEDQKQRGIAFFRECATLYHHLFFHPDTKGSYQPGKDVYQKLVRSFESWVALGMLSYQSDFLVREALLNEENPSQFIDMALHKIDQVLDLEGNPVADVLFHICKLPDSGYLFDDIDQVYKRYQRALPHMGEFERNVASKALISRINTLIAAKGDPRLFSLLFGMYKDGLEAGTYVEQGAMNVQVFLNIAITGATTGEFEWTENFIRDYSQMIDEKERVHALPLSRAYLSYNKGQRADDKNAGIHFDAAKEILSQIRHGQPNYELRVRSLQLRIFYEYDVVIGKNIELLTNFSRSFRQYLYQQDNRLAESRIQAYLDFIHYTLKLARLHSPAAEKPLEKLEKTILAMEKKSTQTMMRHWLMEKAEELKKLLR